MTYVDDSIGIDMVTCSRLRCLYVLLQCCTCDKMIMCVSCLVIPRSLYLIHEQCEYEHHDLIGLITFVMHVYG